MNKFHIQIERQILLHHDSRIRMKKLQVQQLANISREYITIWHGVPCDQIRHLLVK